MQWCTVGRETNGLASGRVTRPDSTARSMINRIAHVPTKEQVRQDVSHWKLKNKENFVEK
jgi:hypothetical protein